MQEFAGRVAVITGAASGLGRSLAFHCAREGMKVVAADVNAQALAQVESELSAAGAPVIGVQTDVSKSDEVERLAERALSTYGAVHLLFNNAGIAKLNRIWEVSEPEWEWVLGVNLWGVIHVTRVFVPILLAQEEEAHIVNTASVAGLYTGPALGAYRVTKHGVVALSEVLYYELAEVSKHVKVSVLCPGFVNTPLFDNSAHNRPASVPAAPVQYSEGVELEAAMRAAMATSITPDEIAAAVFAAIREERFYILTHPAFNERIQRRMEDIVNGHNPSWR